MSKIVLGTVQFGLNYGVSNKEGKPSQDKVFAILDQARQLGIQLLDTADEYGNSSDLIGEYQKRHHFPFKVISKFCLKNESQSLDDYCDATLARLNISSLHSYFFHRFADFARFRHFEDLDRLKSQGKIVHTGVSVYSNAEIQAVIEHPYSIDHIQLPYNLFDCSKEKEVLLKRAQEKGMTIFARSIFLQGLFFMTPEELSGNLNELKEELIEIQKIQLQSGFTMEQMALGFGVANPHIDYVVLGVDSVEQLKKNLQSAQVIIPSVLEQKVRSIHLRAQELLNPSQWRKG